MDNSIMYIIIALVIIAVIVWLAMTKSKNKKQPASAKPVANPVPRHLQEEKSEPVPTSLPEHDYLSNAQSFLSQQRYDEAESELKSGLKHAPLDNTIKLKLLNVYALTSNRDAFNRLYSDFKSQADLSDLQQADDLKAMLDEEDSLKEASQAAQSSEPIEDTPLEFNFDEGFDNESDNTASKTTQDSISFDDLESQLLDDTVSNVESSPSTDTEVFDLSDAMDFDFDMQETPDPTATEPVVNENPLKDNDLDGFNLDNTALDSTALDNPTNIETALDETAFENIDTINTDSNNDFDFDNDSKSIEPIKEKVLDATEVSDDFDLKSGTDDLNTSKAEHSLPSKELSFDSMDADFDDNSLSFEETTAVTDTQESTSMTPQTVTVESKVESTPDSVTTIVPDITTTEVESESNTAVKVAAAAVQAVSMTTVTDDTFAQFDALSDDERLGRSTEKSVTPPSADTSPVIETSSTVETVLTDSKNEAHEDTPVTSLSEDEASQEVLQEAPQEVTQEAITSVAASPVVDDTEFMKTFDFVQELDNSQITLDLANQYLELGEYESARRLVDEVLQLDITEQQKTAAQDILSRMD